MSKSTFAIRLDDDLRAEISEVTTLRARAVGQALGRDPEPGPLSHTIHDALRAGLPLLRGALAAGQAEPPAQAPSLPPAPESLHRLLDLACARGAIAQARIRGYLDAFIEA